MSRGSRPADDPFTDSSADLPPFTHWRAVGQDTAVTMSDSEYLASLEQLGRFFMGTSDVHIALARVTKRLEELGIPYAVCGGMALNAHGYKRATTDVDVLVTADGLKKFKEHSLGLGWLEKFPGSRGVKDAESGVPIDFLVTGGIPGYGTEHGVTFPDPAAVSIEIAGTKYVSLAKLIEMKIASGLSSPHRLLDLDDAIRLIRINVLGEHFADQLHPHVRDKYLELWRYAQIRDSHAE